VEAIIRREEMSARSFRSVFMVATCAGAALTCYLVSLRVASERAALEQVETKIVLAQRDIRLLQTEIGTRGRLAQLERWNVRVLALSAPSADQFLEGGFQLARLARPEPKLAVEAPVVLASAPAPQPRSVPLEEGGERVTGGAGVSIPAAQMMREASLKVQVHEVPMAALPQPKPVERRALQTARPAPQKPSATAAKPAAEKAGDKKVETAAKAVTKPVRLAKNDPLAPLPAKSTPKKTARDSGSAR
jgi:hypothetical protein